MTGRCQGRQGQGVRGNRDRESGETVGQPLEALAVGVIHKYGNI